MIKKNFGLFVCASLFLAHCGSPYQIKSLRTIRPDKPDAIQQNQDVIIRATLLSYEETKQLFNNRGHKLRKRGTRSKNIQPILISVQNNSPYTWLFSTKDINLEQKNYIEIYNRLKHHPVSRALIGTGGILSGLGVTSLVGIGVALTHPVTAPPAWIGIALQAASWTMLIGGGIGTSQWAKEAERNNDLLKEELKEKMLMDNEMAITPNRVVTKLIFIQSNHIPPQFKVTLENESYLAQKLPFYVDLEQNIR